MSMNIVTHNARFHADDVFAVATLQLYFGRDVVVTRTRDESIITQANCVVDVGQIYDPTTLRFDHHQAEGAGARLNGIPYASFGLVWKEFGEKLCGSRQAMERVDHRLVQSIDAYDNGISLCSKTRNDAWVYLFNDISLVFGNTWTEHDRNQDDAFMSLVDFARVILEREIVWARDTVAAEEKVIALYSRADDKRIVELDDRYPWKDSLVNYSEPLYVIIPNQIDSTWKVEAVFVKGEPFVLRKPFPESWAGKSDADLVSVTGVPDALFCHRGRFLVVAKTLEGARSLAKLALTS